MATKHTRRVYPNLRAYLEDLKRNGSNQAEFARRMGMSVGYLSDLKNGLVEPSLSLAKRLSDECGVPMESFLTESQQQAAS
jgi:transcriptional regulator with XRE-family HTH domain